MEMVWFKAEDDEFHLDTPQVERVNVSTAAAIFPIQTLSCDSPMYC